MKRCAASLAQIADAVPAATIVAAAAAAVLCPEIIRPVLIHNIIILLCGCMAMGPRTHMWPRSGVPLVPLLGLAARGC